MGVGDRRVVRKPELPVPERAQGGECRNPRDGPAAFEKRGGGVPRWRAHQRHRREQKPRGLVGKAAQNGDLERGGNGAENYVSGRAPPVRFAVARKARRGDGGSGAEQRGNRQLPEPCAFGFGREKQAQVIPEGLVEIGARRLSGKVPVRQKGVNYPARIGAERRVKRAEYGEKRRAEYGEGRRDFSARARIGFS